MSRNAHVTRRVLLCALAWLYVAPALAHDSWFSRLPPKGPDLALGFSTGTRYPLAEIGPPRDSVSRASCVDGDGATVALDIGDAQPTALPMRVARPGGAVGCWIELHPFDIELAPRIVDVYFRDVHPSDTVRATWSAQLARGLAWQERYRKFARIEIGGEGVTTEQRRAIRRPQGLDLEIVVSGDAPLRVGEVATFQVLSRGEPVPGLPVELVSERNPLGVWSRSDATGRLSIRLPFAGAWLLRGTLIEPDGGKRWKSRFVTLAFDAS